MTHASGLHNVIAITIALILLHTSFRNCCRRSSREVCTTLHEVTAQQTSCLQLSAFPRLVKIVQQCTRISCRRVSSHQSAFESAISQLSLHCVASVSASMPCRRDPNHYDNCKGFRSGCSTIQPSAPSREARLTLAPGRPIRATRP